MLFLGFFAISCSKDDNDDQPVNENIECITPTSLQVSNINFESADLNWDSSYTSGFILEYGESGFSEGTAEVIPLTSTWSYKAENLKANTNYEFFVKAVCVDGSITEPSDRKSFSTDICPVSEISDVVSITETSALVRWWSFNKNYQLEYGLHGFIPGSGTVINTNSDVTLSGLTAGTQYDVYLRTNCNGDFSDYSNVHTFETTPICFEPTDLNGTNITSNSVRINWSPKGETSWQIQYGVVGFQLGSGTTINTSNRPYTIQNLNNNTTYEFYIRANCGGDGFSKWSKSLVITTEYY